ncbi:hypothetical protein [Nostoc sp.]|uniref:hypothetical protein n=1 Tax=Nostoc sp. TaxID=1180 RepID=UPI003FA52820
MRQNIQKFLLFAQVDELETFVGKKNEIWIWTAVNNGLPAPANHNSQVINGIMNDD